MDTPCAALSELAVDMLLVVTPCNRSPQEGLSRQNVNSRSSGFVLTGNRSSANSTSLQ